MTIREKVDIIYKEREDALQQLFAIQKACAHKKTRKGLYGDVRHNNMANICLECDEMVSYVNPIWSDNLFPMGKTN